MNGFDRCSLAIELASDFFPFEEEYLQQPRLYDNATIRVFVHEILHFWQVLSSGYLANLALKEWENLQEFEHSGKLTPPASILRRFMQRNPQLGFSAWNLSEALARFWDLHICGPQKILRQRLLMIRSPDLERFGLEEPTDLPGSEAEPYSGELFDALMLLEDAYAEPYRLSLSRWGSKKSVLLFPLVGYFSLQTPEPVEVFYSVMNNSAIDRIDFLQYRDIHAGWLSIFGHVGSLCKLAANYVGKVGDFTPGWDVVRKSSLIGHPIYRHYFQIISIVKDFQAWQGNKIDFYFACPGDPDCRAKLVSTFVPPLTRFVNGRWVSRASWVKKMANIAAVPGKDFSITAQHDSLLDAETLADNSEDIYARSKKMKQVAKITSLSNRSVGL
jgi:hypothetical protein